MNLAFTTLEAGADLSAFSAQAVFFVFAMSCLLGLIGLSLDRRRKVGQMRWGAESTDQSIDLPYGTSARPIKRVDLVFTLIYTIATADATSPSDYGCLGIIDDMRYEINHVARDKEVIRNLSFLEWFWHNYFCHRVENRRQALAVGQAQQTIRGQMIIPHSQPGPERLSWPPLMSNQLKYHQLTIGINALTDILTAGGGGTAVFNSLTADVYVIEDWSEYDLTADLPVYYVKGQNQIVTATGEEVNWILPVGYLYNDWLLWTKDDSAFANTLISDFRFELKGSPIYRSEWLHDWYGYMSQMGLFDQGTLTGVAGTEVSYTPPTGMDFHWWDEEGDPLPSVSHPIGHSDMINTISDGALSFHTETIIAPTGVAEVNLVNGYYRPAG